MSVHVISWVLRHSRETLGRRLVLIVLADHASQDGSGSWPSVKTIAAEACMSERAVQYALRDLEESGAIMRMGWGPNGTIDWTVRTDLGKFDELPPRSSTATPNSLSFKSLNGSMDGLGADSAPPSRTDCTPGADFAPPWE